jgi:hypothetical protein
MCNCNQKRTMYSQENNSNKNGMVKVKRIDDSPLVMNGDITGRAYIFRALNEINWVDKRDAMSISEKDGLQLV